MPFGGTPLMPLPTWTPQQRWIAPSELMGSRGRGTASRTELSAQLRQTGWTATGWQ